MATAHERREVNIMRIIIGLCIVAAPMYAHAQLTSGFPWDELRSLYRAYRLERNFPT